LNGKALSGEMPWDILKEFKNIRILYLNNNKITGDISNMSKLTSISTLQRLNLSNNLLTGILPSDIPANIQLINVNNNDLKGPLPQSWASKPNFQCFVPKGVCKPKTLTNYSTLCNATPNTTPIGECTDEQLNIVNSNNNADVSAAEPSDNNKNNGNKDSNKVIKGQETNSLKNTNKKKSSHAVLVMFFSIIGILAVIVVLVACFAKYKNIQHSRAMKESLRINRSQILQKFNVEGDTFLKDTAVRSVDDPFTLSKFSEYTGSNFGGSESSSHITSINNNSNINVNINQNQEHAILVDNMNGISKPKETEKEEGSYSSFSRTYDLNQTQTDPSYSYSSNKLNTSSSLYDSSYCSTCDCSLSSRSSSFTEDDSNSSLSCDESSSFCSNARNNTTVDDNGSSVTLESSIGGYDSNKYYLTKRSIVSNTSNRTLINNNNNNTIITTFNNSVSNSVVSNSGTVTTAASKILDDDDNLKVSLEGIAEESSFEISKDEDDELGKDLNVSYILRENSFFNGNHEDNLALKWLIS